MSTQFGNYSDYSGVSKPPASAIHVRDPRLNVLAALIPGIFTAKTCLDIGCNAGSVSTQLALDFQAASVTGVDIDPQLVRQAQALFALRASRCCKPPTTSQQPLVDYFPMSVVLTHGYRIEPEGKTRPNASSAPALSTLPRVNFFSADWVTTDRVIAQPYDVILALSVIKWIHLEHLDRGLLSFFAKCASSLTTGGHLVIELQTWDSYQKAVRPNKAPHFRQALNQLTLRPETSFHDLLRAKGLHLCASSDALPRRIDVYRKA
ncbi:S-adenosyl-L-methionine-dependent methyltransferase [Decorospora gaudefroyi]|uniref:RNA methyltransferase n=1 Tax=Decorospora gaudefroyi TaxID=184978 RepID=A0A6A5K3F0_9PLEO|nr:S-adenosyl-L-methionine-dependent methyltransferase [Decorospora gaudefroyi]